MYDLNTMDNLAYEQLRRMLVDLQNKNIELKKDTINEVLSILFNIKKTMKLDERQEALLLILEHMIHALILKDSNGD